jgi:5-methylcytosine-specific restriction endonuclease McrA
LKELTVHHVDHDHTNNPNDGSNWELLCIYCHDNEHDKYTDQATYQRDVIAGDNNQDTATYNPFADLKSMLKK